jgi:hypothetical protein
MRHEYRVSVGIPVKGRNHMHRWKDNIKMNVKEIGCENVDSIHLIRIRTGCGLF